MNITLKDIVPEISIMKNQIENDITRTTVKLDTTRNTGAYIQPIVSQYVSKNVLLRSNKLSKCVRILAQDTILNDFNFKLNNPNELDNDEEILKPIIEFWDKKNKVQFYRAVQEFYTFGFGCLEIITNQEGIPIQLKQFPAETAYITKDTRYNPSEPDYYVTQKLATGETDKLKLSRFNYKNPEDESLPDCLWIGEGNTHDFYETPYWVPAFENINSKIVLDTLNTQKLNKGNILSGILAVTGPKSVTIEGEKTNQDILEEQMKNAGTGIMPIYLESMSNTENITINYVPIQDNNHQYLSELSKEADQEILSCFSIPKVRLMIDDVTESMNSNKSDTIYEIYTKSLEVEQLIFEQIIDDFNLKYFNVDCSVDIETPIFSDKKSVEITSIKDSFNNALLTLGQALELLQPYYPGLDWETIDFENPLINERYYNGKVLGIVDNQIEDDLIKELNEQIEGVDLI